MHQVSRTVDSITLSWSQPDQPNGVILDYELQYYEKVASRLLALPPQTPLPQSRPGVRSPLPPASGSACWALHWLSQPCCEILGRCLALAESQCSGPGDQLPV